MAPPTDGVTLLSRVLHPVPEAEVKVRRWGARLAVVIPAGLAREARLRPGDRVLMRLTRARLPDPRSFGFLADKPLDAQALKDQLRREHAW